MSAPDHDHLIDTGKGSFSLDVLGPLLPGLAEIMPLVGTRIWKCYYAGVARNRQLATFQLKEAVALLRKGAALRPKYATTIDTFIADQVSAVRAAITIEDWQTFETAFTAMVDSANDYHELYGKGYLRWKVPDTPPPDLDMTPR